MDVNDGGKYIVPVCRGATLLVGYGVHVLTSEPIVKSFIRSGFSFFRL